MRFTDHLSLLDSLPDAVVLIDDAGTLLHANEATERMFGWSNDERLGTSALDLVHPDDLNMALLSLESVVKKDVGTPIELRILGRDGWHLVELVGAGLVSDQVQGGVVLALRDLTNRRRWEVADSDTQLRNLVQNGTALVMLVSAEGIVRSVSGAMARQLGHDAERTIGAPLADLVDAGDRDHLRKSLDLARAAASGSSQDRQVSCEASMMHHDGHLVPYQLSVVDLFEDPTVEGFVITGQDVSELHETRVELAHIASHDSLTGLPNRSAIREILAAQLDIANGAPGFAVGFVDLDRFKPVNDLFGHDAGDELLIAAAGRLENALRVGDVVGRLGGDEFVVIAASRDLGEALDMAERLEQSIARPFRLTRGTVQIGASVGIALAEESSTVDSLLTEADDAMYSVKHGARGNPQHARKAIGDRQVIAEQLASDFPEDEFLVQYQPIVNTATDKTLGYEAFVRWNHPEQGLLHPSAFMDVVAELGHEAALGQIVLDTALRDLKAMALATADDDLTMNVNISATELVSASFAAELQRKLDEAGLEASRLTVELSERAILERSTVGPSTPVLAGLQALQDIGVHIAIDDFGTGHSSLTHLVSYPVDSLKIDQSFVDGLVFDDHRRTIVSALISLGRGMDLFVVAEGVEVSDQARILSEFGCDVIQGYFCGHPKSVSEIVAEQAKDLPTRR